MLPLGTKSPSISTSPAKLAQLPWDLLRALQIYLHPTIPGSKAGSISAMSHLPALQIKGMGQVSAARPCCPPLSRRAP